MRNLIAVSTILLSLLAAGQVQAASTGHAASTNPESAGLALLGGGLVGLGLLGARRKAA